MSPPGPNSSSLAEPAPDIFERLVLKPLSEATKKRYLRRWAAAQHVEGPERRTLERVFGERTAGLIVMGIALLVFSAATRNHLRSAESADTVFSSVASAGWIVAAISQMIVWGWALINGAADADDQAAAVVLGYAEFLGWAGLGIGLATAFIATGLAGWQGSVLPRWFAVVSVVLGVLAALGNAGIPPGGLVTYLLLPFWLLTASVVISKRQRARLKVGG
ncbi:membrane hypothetical protein [Phycicoccus elongatus Lp2]|uniref:Integral membrane protein n=1 Tax=Phycicoccus elongatus Lp2 TaxID=1193181 RepID=N0E579_9MICO|nr:membrane hypothetical protein [Phycicoccus elongatus Lp2]